MLNLASASYIVHMRGLGNLKISGFTDLDFFLRLAVREESSELYSILQKGLASIDKNEQEAIFATYVQPETLKAINWKVWRRRAIESLLIGAVALTAVLFWNRRLAREIRRREAVEAALVKSRAELESYSRELLHNTVQMRALNEKSPGLTRIWSFSPLQYRTISSRHSGACEVLPVYCSRMRTVASTREKNTAC